VTGQMSHIPLFIRKDLAELPLLSELILSTYRDYN